MCSDLSLSCYVTEQDVKHINTTMMGTQISSLAAIPWRWNLRWQFKPYHRHIIVGGRFTQFLAVNGIDELVAHIWNQGGFFSVLKVPTHVSHFRFALTPQSSYAIVVKKLGTVFHMKDFNANLLSSKQRHRRKRHLKAWTNFHLSLPLDFIKKNYPRKYEETDITLVLASHIQWLCWLFQSLVLLEWST